VLWVLAALAAAGFPGLAGFVGQLLVVLGAYPGHRLATPLALLGVLVVAGVLTWTSQRIFFGPAAEQYARVRDVGTVELANGVGRLALIGQTGALPAVPRAPPGGRPRGRATAPGAAGGRRPVRPRREGPRPPRRRGRRNGCGASPARAARRQPLGLDRADTARRRGHQRQPGLSGGGRRQLGPPRVRPGVGVRAHWPDQPDCGRARAGLGQPESGRGAAGAQPDPGRVCVSSGIAP